MGEERGWVGGGGMGKLLSMLFLGGVVDKSVGENCLMDFFLEGGLMRDWSS